ncbi:MAG: TrkA C-terminal domain-containing protein [Phycisphaeraceae bacterium]|nr:MAG: TrkA C-terminal domain-containing protein [Phycisphaeraceae bacterium]
MPIIALFVIAAVSLIIVRIGATALMMTGLSRDVSDFQAISCFFGVGFTTVEAEMIVSHPVRRKIATHLIIAGNIGITGALGALIITLVGQGQGGPFDDVTLWMRVVIAASGVAALFLLFRFRAVRRLLEAAIRFSLEHSGAVRAMDYETILRSRDGYVVSQFEVDPGHPYIGRSLVQLGLGSRGVLILGVLRENGEYLGTPGKDSVIMAGDVLTVYGQEEQIREALQRA